MSDNPEKAIKEAEEWFASARDKLTLAEEDENISSVCCAMAIHSIIRANDALTLYYLGMKATRHDDVVVIFENMIRENKISKANQAFKNLLAKAIRDKSGADYGKKEFTFEDAQDYVVKAEEFIIAVREALRL